MIVILRPKKYFLECIKLNNSSETILFQVESLNKVKTNWLTAKNRAAELLQALKSLRLNNRYIESRISIYRVLSDYSFTKYFWEKNTHSFEYLNSIAHL